MTTFDFLKRADDKKYYIFHCRARSPVAGDLSYGAVGILILLAPSIIFVVFVLLFYLYQPYGTISIPTEIAPFILPSLILLGFALMLVYLNHRTKGCSFRYIIAMLRNKNIIYEYDGKIVGEMRRFTPIKPVTALYPKGALVTIKIEK